MAEQPTVLLVDDDPQVRELYTQFLKDDYDVRAVASGRAALDRMDDDVDAVLLDRRMLELTGEEVLGELRRRGHDVPVAMVTAVDPDFDIVEMGFDDYIVKPVDPDRLREVVRSLLLRKQHDDVVREYFAIVTKVTALEAEKSPAELDASAEYAELTGRLATIKEEARTLLNDAIDAGDFDSLMQSL